MTARPVILVLVGFAALVQCRSAGAAASDAAPVTTAPSQVEEGRLVAIGGAVETGTSACVQCHGMNGAGDFSGAFPRLTGQSGWYLYHALQEFASGKRQSAAMSPIAKELTPGQMEAVAAYYSSIAEAPFPPQIGKQAAAQQKGGEINSQGISDKSVAACDSCHGAHGEGDGLSTPGIAGQFRTYIESALKDFRAGTRQGDPLGVMRKVASPMSDDEIAAVATYFAAQHQ